MSRKIWISLFLFPSLTLAQDGSGDGWNEASGVNLTLEEGFGARHSGMAVTFAGFQTDANAVANAPAAMNDVDDLTFSTAHAEKFGEAKFDDLSLVIPFESRSTLGLGISRYGVSGIDLRPEGVSPLESQPAGQFSIADYLVVAGFSRRWGNLDVGGSLNVLYRQLDQDGLGMRGDAMAQYTWNRNLRVGALIKGLIPSSAAWESGYSEYEAPDLYLGIAARVPAPYFYGTLQAAFQTEGLFQEKAKAQSQALGSRLHQNPVDAFAASNAGLEFLFDFGLVVRFGLSELQFNSETLSSAAFGIGYAWKNVLGLDYSFAPHPDLLSTHRIALQFTPAFPKFNGRNFRSGQAGNGSSTLPPAASHPVEGAKAKATPAARPENPAPAQQPKVDAPPATNPSPVQPKEQLEEEEAEEGE